MLSLNGLDAYYGESHILQDIRLSVGERARVALVGRNGAGKSTLLKSIMNAGPRTRGDVTWEGKSLGNLAEFRRARLGMCLVPEDRRILTHITVLENLQMAARAVPRGRGAADPQAVLKSLPVLANLGDRLGGQLSGGQQQVLAVARALVARPKLMMLDEPTEGLAPVIVEQLARDVNERCREAGTALLLCEQNLWFAQRCTDYVHVIDSGRIVFSGDWHAFNSDTEVKARHLAV